MCALLRSAPKAQAGGGYARSGEPVRSAGGGRRGKGASAAGRLPLGAALDLCAGPGLFTPAPRCTAPPTDSQLLFDAGREILYCCEDIGRHNALDKAVGRAPDGRRGSAPVRALFRRIPADMMEKGHPRRCRCWPAMRFPTDLRRRLARGLIVWFWICTARATA